MNTSSGDSFSKGTEAVIRAVDEIRASWVDNPAVPPSENHRCLFRYAEELKVMQVNLREYAYSDNANDHEVVKAVFDYIIRAHGVYVSALYSWIEEATKKESDGASIAALPRVRKLLSAYDPLVKDKLRRYYNFAIMDPVERTNALLRRSASDAKSQLSFASQSAIDELLKKHNEEVACISDQLVDAKLNAEIAQQRASATEVEAQQALRCAKAEQKKAEAVLREKAEVVKQNRHLERELRKLQDLTRERMFPDAANVDMMPREQTGPDSMLEDGCRSQNGAQQDHLRTGAESFVHTKDCSVGKISAAHQSQNSSDCSQEVFKTYLEHQNRNEYITLASQIGYDGHNIAYVFYENQIRKLMEESPCADKRLEVLRASCIGQLREMINLFFGPMRNMPTSQRIERALDRMRERYGVSGGFVTEPEVVNIRTGPRIVHTITSLKSFNESLNTLEVFAHAHNELEKLGDQLLMEVAGRLPDVLKRRYLDFLVQYEMDLNRPGFTALRQFVVRELRIMTSEYGQGFFRSYEKERFCEPVSGNNVQVNKVDTKSGKFGRRNLERGCTRTRTNSLQMAVRAQGDGILEGESQSATGGTRKACEDWPSCCIHPLSKHKTADCRSFLDMGVEDRRRMVRDKDLCYFCFGHHLARNCKAKQYCNKCQGRHSVLLHLEAQPNQEDVSEGSAHLSHINAVETKINRELVDSDCPASVPLMVLKAVKTNSKPETSIPFYALLDTGADSNICTKELAEELFGWKPKERVSIQFLEETPKSYPCMKKSLCLKHGDETLVKLDKVTFIDKTLPYKECVPGKEEFERHDLPQGCFPVLPGRRRIDMILGTKDMRRFRLWETCSWKEILSREPLIGEHPLGPIYWGVKINECKSQQICTAHLINETPHYLNQVLEIVSAEHNISVDKCAEYVPTLLQDISCYYQDQLILEPNSEEMVMSKEDEMVLNFYQENLKETFDDNGHRRLQLKLPWRPGCPHTVPESLHIAKRRLKGQQKKLANHPERAFKYKEAFEKMKAEGHAEPVKKTEKEDSKSTHYITHFLTEQQKFRVVYNGALSINGHFGPDLVFGVLQQDKGLWPIGGTGTIRHYTKDCIGCIVRRQIKGNQLMAPLLAYRLKPFAHVFAYTASDFAGPFCIVVGRSTVRRWLCVFVCLTTTAIWIELVADLTTSAFLNAFRRFLCSTGFRTKFMRTDNGTNYVGANNVLKREVQTSLAQLQPSKYAQNKMDEWEVEWEFGPPEASHHGGIYERQIRTIRKALAALPDLHTRSPTEDDLLTCFKMAEYIINCRPLTKSPSDDGLPPPRPIDLMVGALDPRKNCAPPATSSPRDELRRGHRFTKRIAELWWDRWLKTYVSELQQRKKWRQETRDFQVGDLVPRRSTTVS